MDNFFAAEHSLKFRSVSVAKKLSIILYKVCTHYQIFTRKLSARYILSPFLIPNAS